MSNLQLHKDGYIIGGNHHRGLLYREEARRVMRSYIVEQFENGNLRIRKSANGKIRYRIKYQPRIGRGVTSELHLLRAQHFLRNHERLDTSRRALDAHLMADTEWLVEKFKH